MKKIFGKFAVLLLGIFLVLPIHAFAENHTALQVDDYYDFGDIYQEDGPVSVTLNVKNSGNETLEINRLSTSCGCTTAEMDLSDMEQGEERELSITFDPRVHEDQTGEIVRMVYLQTSDERMPETVVEIRANVMKKTEVEDKTAKIFFNEACSDCGELVHEVYPDLFGNYGYEIEKYDYINDRAYRDLLTEFNDKFDIPFELQSHLETFVGNDLFIFGHVPEDIVKYLLENPAEYEKILVYQDKMHGEGTFYKVWDFEGEVKTYDIEEPITTFLEEEVSEGDVDVSRSESFWKMFAVITPSAFLDGINPCAIAVLLFFIAFLFSIKKTKESIWKLGIAYISAIFLAYFLIGLGIAQAIIISGAPHLMAYVGAYLVIALGVIQLLGLVFPKFPIRLRIPVNTKATMEKWLHKATVPAAFVGGFIVGLCTFPCSGGIYVAILGMLAGSGSYWQGLGWMVWYNLIFVLPLIILLILAANKKSTEKLQKLERVNSRLVKLTIALTMIALGIIIILFFT